MNKDLSSENQAENLDEKIKLPSTSQDLAIWNSNFFKQSNYLVEAVFEQPFKEFELKVLGLISKYISQNTSLPFDEEGKLIKITIYKQDFCSALNLDPQNFYQQAKSLTPDFHKKSIFIEMSKQSNKTNPTKKEFYSIVLVPQITCKNNQIIFYISPILQPYLQKLKAEYTLLSLEYISKMGSSYAIKIYQLLAQYQKLKKRSFAIAELKKILGISNKYRDFQRFKEEVIEVAITHINQNSNLKISFDLEKNGKKIENIIFKIFVKETQFQQAIRDFTEEMDKILKEEVDIYDLTHKNLKKSWKENKKDIKKHIELFNEWISQRTQNYRSESFERLCLLENKNWYENFQQKAYHKILEEYNSEIQSFTKT